MAPTAETRQTYECFFYGTLMASPVLHRVIYGKANPTDVPGADKLTIEPALLEGYCRRCVKGADYPGITADSNHSVRGTYVTGLTAGDVQRLDLFEGHEYRKNKVKVKVLNDKDETVREEQAITYLYTDIRWLHDQGWDFEHFKKEKMSAWSGDSQEFAESDAAMGDRWWGNGFQEKEGLEV